jgi:hypothetical protein
MPQVNSIYLHTTQQQQAMRDQWQLPKRASVLSGVWCQSARGTSVSVHYHTHMHGRRGLAGTGDRSVGVYAVSGAVR